MRFLERATLDWMGRAFGRSQLHSVQHRGLRHAEESMEALQATGVPADQAHRVVDVVYSRPVGKLAQEIGGSWVTLVGLAYAHHMSYTNPHDGLKAELAGAPSLDYYAEAEVLRVLAKDPAHFKQRNAEKDALGLRASDIE